MIELFIWLGVTIGAWALAHWGYMEKFWAFCMFIMGFIYESLVMVGDLTVRAFQQIASLTAGIGEAPCATGLGSWMAIANTFAPVDECLHLLAALVLLWIAIGVYRLIKSWIPTLTGG